MSLAPLLALVTSAPVTGGTVDATLPAVVVIVAADHAICTGTLIAPDLVLTAAHCLPAPTTALAVQAGADLAHPVAGSPVDTWWSHPRFDGVESAADVAVLHLRDRITSIAPLPLADPATARVDATFTIAGWGRPDPDGLSGTERRIGTVRIADIGDAVYTTVPAPSQVCHGDSGGPLLVYGASGQPAILGVISAAEASCTDWGRVARLDAVATWLDAFTRAEPGPIGSSCVRDDQCAGGRCVVAADDPLVTVCAAPCGAGCPAGSHCVEHPAGEALCLRDGPAPGAPGATCASELECAAGTCAVWDDGAAGTCTITCLVDDHCPEGQACEDTVEGGGACRAAAPASGGCNTGRGGGGMLALVLAAIAALVRPRRTRCSPAALSEVA